MSFDVNWDLDKHREEHESDEHWLLRRNFMERWKDSYPEDRLICLARVFANMEFMGCRYPQEVMQEVARLSKEVNKNLTYSDEYNANLPYFYDVGGSLVQNSASAGSTLPINATEGGQGPVKTSHHHNLVNNNIYSDAGSGSNKNFSAESEYVWRRYSSEVMQGPVSISKVLQTTHSKTFIRDNSLNQNVTGNSTWRRFPSTNVQQPSPLSNFIDKTHLVGTENSSNPVLWHRREPKTVSSLQDSGVNSTATPQQDGTQSSIQQANQDSFSADHTITPMSHSAVENTPSSAHDLDMRFGISNDTSQDQTMTNYDENYHNVDNNLGIQMEASEDQTMQNYGGNAIQEPATSNMQVPVDSLSGLTNCTEEPIILSQEPKNPLPQKSNSAPVVSEGNKVIEKKNKSKKAGKPYKKVKYHVKQLSGVASKRYKYWLHVGKKPHEARELCLVRLSRVPEYKEIKKSLGSACAYNKAYLKFVHKKYPRKGPPPPQAFQQFEKIYKPKLKKNNIITPINNMGADASIINAATSKIAAAASNISSVARRTRAAVKNTGATVTAKVGNDFSNLGNTTEVKNTGNIYTIGAATSNIGAAASNIGEAASNTIAAVKNTDTINYQERLKYWLRMGKTKKEAKILSQLSLGDNKKVKQLKAKSTETMLKKLAHKEHFKQFIRAKTPPKVNTPTTTQPNKNATNKDPVFIEISDDDEKETTSTEAAKKNSAKIRIAKEVQEKRRIWWLQQGKTEEEAAILCQTPMVISDALERIPEQKEIMDKERHDKKLPQKLKEAQSYHTSIPTSNTSSTTAEAEPHINYTETDNSSMLRLGENLPLEARNDKRDHHSTAPHQDNTSLIIPKLEPCANYTETDIASKPSLGENASQFQIFVKDANTEISKKKLTELQIAITRCISDNKEIRNPLVAKKFGCAVVTCVDEQSRDWFDKEIPTLIPWDGAQLEIIDEIKAPVHVHAWIYLPSVPESGQLLRPGNSLKKLHKQNRSVGCDRWIVMHAQMMGEGQLLFVRFDDKSEKVLKSLGYKLNWYSSRPIKVRLKNKNKPQNMTLVNEQQNQNKLNNPKKYMNIVNNLPNKGTIEPSPMITLSDDDSIHIAHVENVFYEDSFIDTAPEMNVPKDAGSVVNKEGPMNPVKMSSYSEITPMECDSYPPKLIPSQPSPLLRSEQTASVIDARMPHLVVLTEPATSIKSAKLYKQATSSAMDQVGHVSSQLGDVHQKVNITELVSERVPPSRLIQENCSETGQKSSRNFLENKPSALKHSRTEDNADFWGIDAPRLLPGHRAAITLKTDVRDYDYSRERAATECDTGYVKEVNAFAGYDEEYSLEERVFAARKKISSRDEKVCNEKDQQHSLENRVFTERYQEYAQDDRAITGRQQNNYREVREFDEQDQDYPQNIVVTVRDQENYRDVREFSERDQGYSQENRAVTDCRQEYFRQDRIFDERDQGTSQGKNVTVPGHEYYQDKIVFDGKDREYSQEDRVVTDREQEYYRDDRICDERDQGTFQGRIVNERSQEHSRENRVLDERDQRNSQDRFVTERSQEEYREVRDFAEQGRGYSQQDRVVPERERTRFYEENNFSGQDNKNREQEYYKEHRLFNERGREYSRQEKFYERDKEYSHKQRDYDGRGQGSSQEHRNLNESDKEYTRESRVGRVQGYSSEDRLIPGPGKGGVFDRRNQEYHREDGDCYQTGHRSPNAHSGKSGYTRGETDSRNHFRRSEDRAAYGHCQDSRPSYNSYGTNYRSRELSRGDGALATIEAIPKKKRKSGASIRKAQKQKRLDYRF